MGELRRIGCRREPAVSLAFAFGMAVTGTITIITLLHFYTAWQRWHVPTRLLALAAAPLLVVDPLFLAANATKIVHGAWLPPSPHSRS